MKHPLGKTAVQNGAHTVTRKREIRHKSYTTEACRTDRKSPHVNDMKNVTIASEPTAKEQETADVAMAMLEVEQTRSLADLVENDANDHFVSRKFKIRKCYWGHTPRFKQHQWCHRLLLIQ